MPKKLSIIFIVTIILIAISVSPASAFRLDNAHYMIKGNGEEITSLNLNLNYDLDNINGIDAFFKYYNGDIKLKSSWLINFYNRPDNNLNIEFSLLTGLNNLSPDLAIGFSGVNSYQGSNDFYWNVKYLFDDNKSEPIIYEGGIILPLNQSGKLTIGLGNSYWDLKNPRFSLGFIAEF